MKKFLILNPFGIGDVLFTTPLIEAIKKADPKNLVSYWCNERVKELLSDDPRLDKIFALSRGDLKKIFRRSKLEGIKKAFTIYRGIRKEKFGLVFDFSLDSRYGFLLKFMGIPQRLGFDYKGRGRYLTRKIKLEGYSGKHIVQYYRQLLELAGLEAQAGGLSLFLNQEAKTKAEALLASGGINQKSPLIGIAPGGGASWGKDAPRKHWGAVNFAQLAGMLISRLGAQVVILGSPDELPLSQTMRANLKYPLLDLTGKTNLKELAALINSLDILVTNDGGPLHMAVALNKKTVSIFGPVDEDVYGPYPKSDRHIVITNRDITCRPCYRSFRLNECLNTRRCIEDIPAEEVFTAAKLLLTKG